MAQDWLDAAGSCRWHGCGRPATEVIVTFDGWLIEVCVECAVERVLWPPQPNV